jgi:hypothetical protein
MMDYIKVCFVNKSHTHNLKNKFDLTTDVDDKTGEISGIYRGTIEDEYKIELFPSGRCIIKGSLHKRYNKGANDSDFTYPQLLESVQHFSRTFELPPQQFILENLEYGVNISLPYSPKIILENLVSLRTGNTFSDMTGGGLTCKRYEYRVKVYNKSAQYKVGNNLLRFEIHDDKMRRQPTVKTLHDLTKPEVWKTLADSIQYHANQLIFTDDIDKNELARSCGKNLSELLDKFNNSRCWKEMESYQRNRSMKKLETILNYGKYQTSATFKEGLNSKLNYILSTANNSQFNY